MYYISDRGECTAISRVHPFNWTIFSLKLRCLQCHVNLMTHPMQCTEDNATSEGKILNHQLKERTPLDRADETADNAKNYATHVELHSHLSSNHAAHVHRHNKHLDNNGMG